MLGVTAVALLLARVASAHAIVELHGSGTTNPSRWMWEVMELLTARAKAEFHMTYRAIGSSNGMADFVGATYKYVAQNDFGAGDIPMTKPLYDAMLAHGRGMVHVPIAIGGIGVFHSVPESELGGATLNLDACLLAEIYAGSITKWNDPKIKAKNPTLTATSIIYVAHRDEGSSSTAGFTEYLTMKCPEKWTLGGHSHFAPEEKWGNWPVGVRRQGSDGMATYLEERSDAIAYIDAGHGHSLEASEIALKNLDGVYLTSKQADIGAAATKALEIGDVFPEDPTASFANVNLYDQPGAQTWPITMVTYLYLQSNYSTMEITNAALLKAFVQFMISKEGQSYGLENLFDAMPQELIDLAKLGIASVTWPVNMTDFVFETDYLPGSLGQQDNVISAKRQSFADYERAGIMDNVADLWADHEADDAKYETRFAAIETKNVKFTAMGAKLDETVVRLNNSDKVYQMALAGVILGSVGAALGLAAFVVAVVKRTKHTEHRPSISTSRIEIKSVHGQV